MGICGNVFVGLFYGMTKVGCRFIQTLKHKKMKSRISIDIDLDNKPYIKIEYIHSDDLRDKMVGRFLEEFGGEVCFAKFQYSAYPSPDKTISEIRPIPYGNLKEEIKVMNRWIEHAERDILPQRERQSD